MNNFVMKKGTEVTTAAPREPNAEDFKMPLPKSRRGTHGVHHKPQRPTAPAQNDDAQEVDYANRYDGSELGSTGDTTTNLTQEYIQHSQEQRDLEFGQRNQYSTQYQPYQRAQSRTRMPFDARVGEEDIFGGLSDGEHSDEDHEEQEQEREIDTHILDYMNNKGMPVSVSRSRDPEEYARVHAFLNEERLRERAEAEADAQSYPTTTTGEPSIVPEHYEPNQHPEQYGLDSLPVRPLSQPVQSGAHQMAPPQHLPNKAIQPPGNPFAQQSQTVHRDQGMRPPAMPLQKDTRAYAHLARHQHEFPPGDQARQRQRAPTNPNGVRAARVHSPPPQMNAAPAQRISVGVQGQTDFEPELPTPTKTPKHKRKFVHRDTRPRELEDALPDYDEEALHKKTFAALQGENYDMDPRSQSKGPQELGKDELHKRLQRLLTEKHGRQRKFLDSLDIEEWDQAGDWFVDRFADMMTRLKNARSERRKISRDYEAEVAKRHEVVSKKRKVTEDELKGMKVSGKNVLDTPKKMRKHL